MLERPPSLLDGLNDDQQRAVTTVSGPVLVVAGPGSGKTRVLAHRVAYLIQHERIPPERILAVTFTNKAAREMRTRIERLLGGAMAAHGLTMGTFHSLGVRFLRQNPGIVADRIGILPNFLIYDDADQLDLAKKAIIDVGLDPKNVAPRRMLSRISAAKSLLLSPDEFAAQVENYDDEIVLRVYRAYQTLLRKSNAVDFDDLLGLPLELFDAAPALLEHYQEQYLHVLVDEYQDTNRVQYVLVSALSGKHRNLFVVGDPDQSIYGWRQADIRNILDFQKDFPDASVIHLEMNYRSTRRIVDTADRVIRVNTERIDRRLRTMNEDGELVILRELSDGQHEARFIVDEVRRLVRTGQARADQIAVMYRTTAQSRVLEEAFRMSDIPYRIVGGVRFYDRKEVKDILAIIRILYNPADETSLQRIIDNTPLGRSIGPKAVDTIRDWTDRHDLPLIEGFVAVAANAADSPGVTGATRAAAQRLGLAMQALRGEIGHLKLSELFDQIIERSGYKSQFREDSEEEMQRWANVLELRSDLSKFDEVAPEHALAQYLEQVALIADIDALDDEDQEHVTLITLHSAKGLEFPIVFIAGVEEGLLPISRAVEAEYMDPRPMEEERRLFYVGITRAQKQLYLTYAGVRMTYGRFSPVVASRFLANLPQDNVKSLGTRSGGTSSVSSPRLLDRVRGDGHVTTTTISRPQAFSRQPSPAPAHTFTAGERVFHARFGEGVIAEANDRHGDQELAIEFARHGRKRLLASLANLEVITE